jgi:hypothetical protein
MRPWLLALLAAAPLACARPADARIVRLEITRVEPFLAGHAFGTAGAFERVIGRAHGEVDPKAPANAGIQDIGLAPKNARGMVEYSTDIEIIRPADAAKSNHVLLFDIVNRGNKTAVPLYNADVPGPLAQTNGSVDPGDGWLQRLGMTVVYFGWQADVLPGDGRMTFQVPVARNPDGSPLTGIVRSELVVPEPVRTLNLSSGWFTGMTHASYPTVSLDKAAQLPLMDGFLPGLTVRPRENAAHSMIDAGDSSFADCAAGAAKPDATKICYPAGFQPGRLYELFYRARDPLVMGLGFAVARDLASFLKAADKDAAGTANPVVHGKAVKTIVSGSGQGGRMIRSFLLLGFNRDEAGQRAFDGALVHDGGGRLALNVRFAQPGRGWGQQVDHLYPGFGFPFAYARTTDPLTGRTQGILDRCAADKACPRLFDVATALMFWEGRQSLGLTDPLAREDLHEPAEVRSYLLAGTQNTPASLPLPANAPFGACVQQANPATYTWTMRALLADLTAWVRDDAAPPPSAVPHILDGTLVAPDQVRFPAIPATVYGGAERPAAGSVMATNPLHVLDFGRDYRPGEASGVITTNPPRQTAAAYATLVPQVDEDGIDVSGVRSVYQLAPIGTYTGWNLFRPGLFDGGGFCAHQGSFIPFAQTTAERVKAGDPRLSIAERYASPFAYTLAIRSSADILVRRRFMLPEDADRVTAEAEKSGIRKGP